MKPTKPAFNYAAAIYGDTLPDGHYFVAGRQTSYGLKLLTRYEDRFQISMVTSSGQLAGIRSYSTELGENEACAAFKDFST
jgi:hypothetical protein